MRRNILILGMATLAVAGAVLAQDPPAPPAKSSSKLPALPVLEEEATTALLLQEVGDTENEAVHIGEDVTARYFHAPRPVPVEQYQVVHIGEDVTVRYFTTMGRHTTN